MAVFSLYLSVTNRRFLADHGGLSSARLRDLLLRGLACELDGQPLPPPALVEAFDGPQPPPALAAIEQLLAEVQTHLRLLRCPPQAPAASPAPPAPPAPPAGRRQRGPLPPAAGTSPCG